jgi:L-alanine-DL-glutamate epimerase-like enolase superfamily enzyme
MIPAMKITAIETFVVNTGFKPPRPWHFCAIRTDEGLTGYNGHLSSFQALNFVASVSNVKIMESDPDAVPLRDELFTVLPEIKDGQMTIPTRPGWGTELNEKAARAHAWEG